MAKFRRGFSRAKEEAKRIETERASWGKKLGVDKFLGQITVQDSLGVVR